MVRKTILALSRLSTKKKAAMRTIITAQSGLLQVKLKSSKKDVPIGAKRRKITKFTRASRKRFLDTIARLNIRRNTKLVMITVTYGENFPDEMQAKEHLWALTTWLKRKNPRAAILWRLEPQERGAPHFHLLAFGLKFIPHDRLAEKWRDIIGIESAANYYHAGCEFIKDVQSEKPEGIINDFPQTNIERIKGKRKAMNYVAKYCAKLAPSADERSESPCFNDVAYLDTPEISTGRFWGVIGRKYLPFGQLHTYECTTEPIAFHRWQFSAAQQYRAVGKRPTGATFNIKNRGEEQPGELWFKEQGFSLYVTDAKKWMKSFMETRLELLAAW